MKRISFALSILILFGSMITDENHSDVLPTPSQQKWADAEIGVIIHLDINIFVFEHFNYEDATTLPERNRFNPRLLNTDQWIASAKAAGANYALLTAKHGTGFCLWPSRANDYNVGHANWKNGSADVVKDFIASCKKYGLKPGLYYNTNFNSLYGAGYKPFTTPQKQSEYNQIVLKQLTELWSNYGELFEIWFDGGIMVDEKKGIASAVQKLITVKQPNAVLFQGSAGNKNLLRWIGNEDGRAPIPNWSRADATTSSTGVLEINGLNGNPAGSIWCPGAADFPNRKSPAWNGGWLWKAGEEKYLFSEDELLDRYCSSVGRNANMLIGMAIDTNGLFPKPDSVIFSRFGEKVKTLFKTPLAKTAGSKRSVQISIPKSAGNVRYIVLMEDISKGERIRKYHIDGLTNNGWEKLHEAESVGHKAIIKVKDSLAKTFRLVIDKSEGTPYMRQFAVY